MFNGNETCPAFCFFIDCLDVKHFVLFLRPWKTQSVLPKHLQTFGAPGMQYVFGLLYGLVYTVQLQEVPKPLCNHVWVIYDPDNIVNLL